MQTKFAPVVTSGMATMQCAVAALEIDPGDEVILPAWTRHSCFNVGILAGALSVCAQIETSFNNDREGIESHITRHTKAIMAVHPP